MPELSVRLGDAAGGLSVTVEAVEAYNPRSSVLVGIGRTPDGRRLAFAGATREMLALAVALEAGEEPVTSVPSWAVLTGQGPNDAA